LPAETNFESDFEAASSKALGMAAIATDVTVMQSVCQPHSCILLQLLSRKI